MKTFDPAIAACLAANQLDGLYWLAEVELSSGTLYLSDSKIIEWNGHVWSPYLDPEEPLGDIEESLKLDEKNNAGLNLGNIDSTISAIIRSNDIEHSECRIYLYFEETGQAALCFRGVCSKADALKEGVVEVPVIPHLHGPRVKLPGEKFSTICRFACRNFGDGKSCLYDPANGYGAYQTGTTPYASCPGTRKACGDRGMMAVNKKAPWDASSDPLPWCNFGGFAKFTGKDRGSYKSGFLGLGRTRYTSTSRWPDNFLGSAIPLVYGRIMVSGKTFYSLDESSWFLGGAIFSDGRCEGIASNSDVYLNGDNSHQYPWFTQGWVGQRRPNYLPASDSQGSLPDAYAGTAYAVLRVPDEVGVQSDRDAEIEALMKGRQVSIYQKVAGEWVKDGDYWSDDPMDIMADLLCSDRGGLRFGYDKIDLDVFDEKAYSWESIFDRDGKTRKRFMANGAVMDSSTAGEVLERFREEFSMFFRLNGEKITWGFIRPNASSVFTFDHALHNIAVGEDGASSVEVSERPAEDVPNRLYVSFLDEDNNFEKTTFHLDAMDSIVKAAKVIDESWYLAWTTNIGQALRIASNKFERLISGNYKASWVSPLSTMAVEVGDVVTLVSDHLPNGQQTMLITKRTLTWDFSIKYEAELYQGSFYDDLVSEDYSDFIREPADAKLRFPAAVTGLSAVESPVILDGQRYSEVTVTYTPPADDAIWHHAETWWRADSDPADSWHYADQSFGGTSIFRLNPGGGKQLHIRVVSVSRYGVKLDPRSTDNPEVDLSITGTTDAAAPGAPQNLVVTGHSGDNGVPVGTYRITFDSAANWQSVSAIEIECATTLPFQGTPLHSWEIQQDPGNPTISGHYSLDVQESAGGLYFRVRAINSFGEGNWATTASTVSSYKDAGLPGGPSNLAVAVNGYDIIVHWDAPADNAAGIREYQVRVGLCKYFETNGIWTIPTGITTTVDSTQREARVRVPESGEYAVGVLAVNDHGVGPLSIFEEES